MIHVFVTLFALVALLAVAIIFALLYRQEASENWGSLLGAWEGNHSLYAKYQEVNGDLISTKEMLKVAEALLGEEKELSSSLADYCLGLEEEVDELLDENIELAAENAELKEFVASVGNAADEILVASCGCCTECCDCFDDEDGDDDDEDCDHCCDAEYAPPPNGVIRNLIVTDDVDDAAGHCQS